MKIIKVPVITLALITFLLIPILGCGPVSTQTYDFADFTRVEVGSGFHVELVQSDSYSVSITASESLFNFIRVSQEADTLIIGLTGFGEGTKKAGSASGDYFQESRAGHDIWSSLQKPVRVDIQTGLDIQRGTRSRLRLT